MLHNTQPKRLIKAVVARAQLDGMELNDKILDLATRGDAIVQEYVEKVDRLRDVALYSWKPFSEPLRYPLNQKIPELYVSFTYEPLCSLHLEVSRLLKQNELAYLSSERLLTNPK